jgi:hypothetical protein
MNSAITQTKDALTLLTGKPYIPAAQTNVLETFKRFGWTPPSETRLVVDWNVCTDFIDQQIRRAK